MTMIELIQQAQQAEQMGIPVDWKTMTISVVQASQQQMQALGQEIERYKEKLEDTAEYLDDHNHEIRATAIREFVKGEEPEGGDE